MYRSRKTTRGPARNPAPLCLRLDGSNVSKNQVRPTIPPVCSSPIFTAVNSFRSERLGAGTLVPYSRREKDSRRERVRNAQIAIDRRRWPSERTKVTNALLSLITYYCRNSRCANEMLNFLAIAQSIADIILFPD